jgi:tripartite-type tricarboxylate transporter receptor subunit TctC
VGAFLQKRLASGRLKEKILPGIPQPPRLQENAAMLVRNAWDIAAGAALVCLAAIIPLAVSTQNALPQARTIKLINPYPPGGTADIIARLVTEQINRIRGATFVIENRPGAGTVIGADAVARAAPDGNTLLLNSSAVLISAHLRKLNFDPFASFEPICNLTQSPQLLVVNGDSPLTSMADLVALAKAKPGEVAIASTGPASPSHIGIEAFRHGTKLAITYVPYPGNAPTVNAVLGGHVSAGIANYADVVGHLTAGKLRPLVTLTPARIAPLPDLPTIGEAGYGQLEYTIWFGIAAPAKTPAPVVKQLTEWFAAARQAPEVTEKLAIQGLFPEKECGADFTAMMRREYDNYGRVIREAGIKAE